MAAIEIREPHISGQEKGAVNKEPSLMTLRTIIWAAVSTKEQAQDDTKAI